MDDTELIGGNFGEIDPAVVARLVTTTADVAMVIDRDGVVRTVRFGGESRLAENLRPFVGKRWVDIVAPDSRAKAQEMIAEAATGRPARPREINHPAANAQETVPVRYDAVRDEAAGAVFVVGRDLRAVAELEQRLSATQQAIEQEYARLRAADTRYRLLFHLTPEPVLIIDSTSRRIVEANPAAITVLSASGRILGRPLLQYFAPESAAALTGALSQAATAGETTAADLRIAEGGATFSATLSMFRQEGASFVLIRFDLGPHVATTKTPAVLSEIIERMPDALIATDPAGSILEANPSFLELAQLATLDQVRGQPLERWLGRSGVDFSTLVSMLSEYGSVRGFSTILRGALGSRTDVEVSAVSTSVGTPCLGFVLRTVSRPRERESVLRASMPRSVEQLTQLVGRVPLKDLVRETTDIIERLCIEAALSMTGDNRASAAELLGLSRQSLYAKLHRFGLGDLAGPPDN